MAEPVEFWTLKAYTPDAPVLVTQDNQTLTASDLETLIAGWAVKIGTAFDGTAVQTGLIALEFETSVQSIAAYLAALRSGHPVVLVEPGHAGPETPLQRVYAPDVMIRRADAQADLAVHVQMDSAAVHPAAHADLRLLLSTSGSTGDPKLVRLSGDNINSNAVSIAQYLELTPKDRAMLSLPLFYSYGLSVLNSYLSAGASLVLNAQSVVDEAFWTQFRGVTATSLALVPHQFDLLEGAGFLDNAAQTAPSLRYITQAGGRLDPETARRFAKAGAQTGFDLILMYGQTEAAPRISWVPPKELPEAADTIGQAVPGGKLWLADEQGGEITAANTAGELVYEGPNVMMGYGQSREDLTKGSETPYLKTGDIAERTETGMFRIVGRMKRFVKLYGLRLSLDQIEAFLARNNQPVEAVAVHDQLVLLCRNLGQGETVQALVAEEYELPLSSLHVADLEELPLLASGKTDRPALQKIAAQALEAAQAQVPAGLQASLSEVLGQATRSRIVEPADSFISLGGDSLSYLQVQMALEERLGYVPAGWDQMTLAQLEALTPKARTKSWFGLSWSGVSMDVLLRLLAVCLVVAQHASNYPLYGGTWILIVLMGYSAARFQFQNIVNGNALQLAWNMLYPIIPLYYILLVVYNLLRDVVPIDFYVMVADYYIWKDATSFLTVYWFVSLFAQIVLLLVAVTLSKPLARILHTAPFIAPAVVALVLQVINSGIIASPALVEGREVLWPVDHVGSHGLLECLPLFLVSWMIHMRRTLWHTAVIIGLSLWSAVLLMGVAVELYTVVLLVLSVILVVSGLQVPMPRQMGGFLQRMAGLTLFVYLLHNTVTHVTHYSSLKLPDFWSVVVAIPVSFVIAYLGKSIFDQIDRLVLRLNTQTGSGTGTAAEARDVKNVS